MKKNKARAGMSNKTLTLVSVFSALFVIGIIAAIILPDPITGAVKLKEARSFFEDVEPVAVILYDPMEQGNEILSDVEKRLDGEDAKNITDKLQNVLKNVKYKSTKTAEFGVWKTKITVYNSNDDYKLYMDTDGIYILNDGRLIFYSVSEQGKKEFLSLLSDVEDELSVEKE